MDLRTQWTDDLVAYLDGELDDESKRRVESLLAREPAVREELTRLKISWELLESLPAASVGEGFARNTLEMIAISAEHDARASQAWQRFCRRRNSWLVAFAVLLAAAAGYAGADRLWPDRNAALAQDLALLWRLDEYLYAGDMEFARQLAEPKLFGASESGKDQSAAPSGEVSGTASPAASADDPARTALGELSNEQKHDLLRRLERFEALSEADRQRLRELHAAIDNDPQRDSILRALGRYRDWLLDQSLGKRTEILDLDRTARAARITAELQRVAIDAPQLSEADRQALVGWIISRFETLLQTLPEELRSRGEALGREKREVMWLQLAATRGPLPFGSRPQQIEIVQELVRQLSPELKSKWNSAPDRPQNESEQPRVAHKRELAANWLRAAARQELAARDVPLWRPAWLRMFDARAKMGRETPSKSVAPPKEVAEWLRRFDGEQAARRSKAMNPDAKSRRQKSKSPAASEKRKD